MGIICVSAQAYLQASIQTFRDEPQEGPPVDIDVKEASTSAAASTVYRLIARLPFSPLGLTRRTSCAKHERRVLVGGTRRSLLPRLDRGMVGEVS